MTETIAVYKVKEKPEPQALTRRKMWQMYKHLMILRDTFFDMRSEARKVKALMEVQDLTEAIFHVAEARTHLRHMCKARFHCDIEELKSYA